MSPVLSPKTRISWLSFVKAVARGSLIVLWVDQSRWNRAFDSKQAVSYSLGMTTKSKSYFYSSGPDCMLWLRHNGWWLQADSKNDRKTRILQHRGPLKKHERLPFGGRSNLVSVGTIFVKKSIAYPISAQTHDDNKSSSSTKDKMLPFKVKEFDACDLPPYVFGVRHSFCANRFFNRPDFDASVIACKGDFVNHFIRW